MLIFEVNSMIGSACFSNLNITDALPNLEASKDFFILTSCGSRQRPLQSIKVVLFFSLLVMLFVFSLIKYTLQSISIVIDNRNNKIYYISRTTDTCKIQKSNMSRRRGTPQTFCLAFINELEKQLFIKKTVAVGQ